MRTPPLLADFIHPRNCKPICENSLTLPEHFNHRRVEPPFGRRNPKEKDICFSRCLSLLERTVKIDICIHLIIPSKMCN